MPGYDNTLPSLTTRKLFEVNDESRNVFTIGEHHLGWSPFALGYKNGADVLVDGLIKQGGITDVACLPALFLYRHYVELSLKGMLVDTEQLLLSDAKLSKEQRNHYLVRLWDDLRGRMKDIGLTGSEEWMTRAEALIKELDNFDADAVAFRYPVDKKGGPTTLPSFMVDVGHFRDVMDELRMVLDGIAAWLGNSVDLMHEKSALFAVDDACAPGNGASHI